MRIMTVALRAEQDVVTARQRARQIAEQLGFDVQDQARIATSVSEIARNALRCRTGTSGIRAGGQPRAAGTGHPRA
jgi:hypothetical protein